MRIVSRILLLVTSALFLSLSASAQDGETGTKSGEPFRLKSEISQERRDSIRAHKKLSLIHI